MSTYSFGRIARRQSRIPTRIASGIVTLRGSIRIRIRLRLRAAADFAQRRPEVVEDEAGDRVPAGARDNGGGAVAEDEHGAVGRDGLEPCDGRAGAQGIAV